MRSFEERAKKNIRALALPRGAAMTLVQGDDATSIAFGTIAAQLFEEQRREFSVVHSPPADHEKTVLRMIPADELNDEFVDGIFAGKKTHAPRYLNPAATALSPESERYCALKGLAFSMTKKNMREGAAFISKMQKHHTSTQHSLARSREAIDAISENR